VIDWWSAKLFSNDANDRPEVCKQMEKEEKKDLWLPLPVDPAEANGHLRLLYL
jgi:hypothetical protein